MNRFASNQPPINHIQQTAQKFLNRQTIGGLLLIGATFISLLIGNSPWADTYHHYLGDALQLQFSEHFAFELTVEELINEGLMAVLFLVAGLELKREILVGELSSIRKASMPLLAALGGMIVPALIFVSINAGTENVSGWAIPMTTDIAYSLGIIGLLGKRVPIQLKVFLIALAIADDLGAIIVIALFYSNEISWVYLALSGAAYLLLWTLNRSGVKHLFWFIAGGISLWYFLLHSGIHPTIAGVLLAITVPVKPELDSKILKERTVKRMEELENADIEHRDPLEDPKQQEILNAILEDTEQSMPPLLKLENALTGFNAFFIIPVFAVANAGVNLDVNLIDVVSDSLSLGILFGLVVGKVLGITLFAYVGEMLGVSELHRSLSWWHIIGMGTIAGIGFTMSLFITNLAFSNPEMANTAKISVLIASFISAVIGISILLMVKAKNSNH